MPVMGMSTESVDTSRFHNSEISESMEWEEALQEIERGGSPLEELRGQFSDEILASLEVGR